jgi:hypothetical protein
VIVESKDSEKLCVFLKGGLGWPWSRKVTSVDEATDAIDELEHEYPLSPPSPDDIHLTINYPILKARYPLAHVGLYHFAMWVPKGQAHSKAFVADELCGAIISKGVIAAAYKFNAVEKFFRRTAPLMQMIGLLFEAIDRPQYIRYHRNYNDFASKSLLRLFQTTHRTCFLGLALLRNLQAEPHKDISDIKDEYVAMVCFGDFFRGEFVVPELGLKLDFKPRTLYSCILLFSSTLWLRLMDNALLSSTPRMTISQIISQMTNWRRACDLYRLYSSLLTPEVLP